MLERENGADAADQAQATKLDKCDANEGTHGIIAMHGICKTALGQFGISIKLREVDDHECDSMDQIEEFEMQALTVTAKMKQLFHVNHYINGRYLKMREYSVQRYHA